MRGKIGSVWHLQRKQITQDIAKNHFRDRLINRRVTVFFLSKLLRSEMESFDFEKVKKKLAKIPDCEF